VRAPDFWDGQHRGLLPRLLAPLGWAYGAATRARLSAAAPWRAPVPVLCVGNLVAGGAGKTPVVLDLGARLMERGLAVHFLSRGYGGRQRGPVRVDPSRHDARAVGDEALLLAARAPTWVARGRADGAQAAVAAGAEVIIMDDGFQNPSVTKDICLLVADGAYGFGNGRVIPAGPLREPVDSGLARTDGLVLIGKDEVGVAARAAQGPRPAMPVLRARIAPGPEAAALAGKPVFAFAGIGRPAKFFATLAEIGCSVVARRAFSDHYPYEAADIEHILRDARAADAVPVTTAKDAVRLPLAMRAGIEVLTITVKWDDEAALDRILDPLIRHGR